MNGADKKKMGGIALKAGFWYVISSVLVRAVSIITTPIFTSLMTTEEYGITATFSSWHTLLLTLCTFNLSYSIERAKMDYSKEYDKYIGSMQVLSALITGIFVVIAVIFIEPLAKILELSTWGVVLLLMYLFFTPPITFAQHGFRFKYRYKENIMIAWYIPLTTVVLSLVLMLNLDGDKSVYRMVGITIPTVFLGLYFWYKAFSKRNLNTNMEYWKYGLKLSAPLIVHTVSMNILYQADRVFIAKICGPSDTGIYSLVYNYGILLSVVTTSIGDGWLPWFHDSYYAKDYENIRKNVKWIIVLGCYVGLACIALAPEAILILGGESYMGGVYCIPPIVLGIVSQFVYTHYVNIEMHLKKTKYVSMGTIMAALLNIVLNMLFIPAFGYIAAAYTTMISYLFLLIVHFCVTRLFLKIELYNDWFMFGSLAATMIVSAVLMVSYTYARIRYGLLAVGLLSFLFVFRKYIMRFVYRVLKK